MGGRLWRVLAPVLLLLVFIVVMTSDWWLKRPFGEHDDVQMYFQTVRDNVQAGDFQRAATEGEKLRAAWRAVATRVQFSAERDQLRGLNVTLARLQAAIMAEDQPAALIELAEAEEHWRDLGR